MAQQREHLDERTRGAVPTAKDSLRRAMREREAAAERGDEQTVAMLDQAIEQLILEVDDPDV